METIVNKKQKISNEQRKEIVQAHKQGETIYSISQRYNVYNGTIRNILLKEKAISQDKSIFGKMWKEILPIVEKMDLDKNSYNHLRSKMKKFVLEAEIESWEDFISLEKISLFFNRMKRKMKKKQTEIFYARRILTVLGDLLENLLKEENFFKFEIKIQKNPFKFVLEESLKRDTSIFDKMWEQSLPFISDMGIADSSIQSLKFKMKVFIERAEIESWEDFINPKRIFGFITTMQEINKSNGYIKGILKTISPLVEQIKEMQGFEQVPIKIVKNPFKMVIKKRKATLKHRPKSYPPRDKDDIETWISLIGDLEKRTFWALGSNGLRTEELMRLKSSQFDLDNRFIRKVWRKGSGKGINTVYQEIIAIPKYLDPILQMYLGLLGENEKLFKKGRRNYTTRFSKKHMKYLKLLKEELESKVVLQLGMKELLDSVTKLRKNGAILNHSFRSTWDTHAGSVGMVKDIQGFHLNHDLEGMKEVYVQIENDELARKRYLKEIDEKAISYDLGD